MLSHCTAALYGEPWAILPSKLEALVEVLSRRKAGDSVGPDELERLRSAFEERIRASASGAKVREVGGMLVRQAGRVAVLSMFGTVVQRPGMFSRYSGGVSAEQFASVHAELVDDPGVGAIVWDVDSPGGSVAGVPESADRLFALRGQKPTVAVSNSMMASAAYWLASAADEVVATPSSLTGSIGVYTAHADRSRANAVQGVQVTYIYAGRKKVDGNPDTPLAEPARVAIQGMVDDYYDQFVGAVARHRKAAESAVRTGYGEGDVLTASKAVTARLADRIETLGGVVARLAKQAGKGSGGGSLGMAAARQRQAVINS